MSDDGSDRTALWLELLTELTRRRSDWVAWKGYGSALAGTGDVDSVAPAEAWPDVRATFLAWATRHGLGPVVVCPHAPGLLHMVALPQRDEVYFELDVNRRKVFLGSTLFRAPDLLPMARLDEHGVRRLRPGAEAVLKLIQNGMSRGARVRWDEIERRGISDLVRADPAGVEDAARLFGAAGGALERGARAVARGRWDRAAMLAVEAHSLTRSLAEPGAVAWRLRFRRQRHRCPVLRSVFDGGRRVPLAERATWLAEVRAYGGHEVSVAGAPREAGLDTGHIDRRRGKYVVVAGPDGTGKSTLAGDLVGALGERPAIRYHHRLGALPRRAASLRAVTEPHAVPPYPAWLSRAKVLYLFLDYLAGTALRVRPALGRGSWIVLERGWWDIVVDPARYRLSAGESSARRLGRLLPRPDLLVVLEAPVETIRERKAELPAEELRRQMEEWARIARSTPSSMVLDSRAERPALVRSVLGALAIPAADDHLGSPELPS